MFESWSPTEKSSARYRFQVRRCPIGRRVSIKKDLRCQGFLLRKGFLEKIPRKVLIDIHAQRVHIDTASD